MNRKGKSRTRVARIDIMKRNAANARRKARQAYDRTRYDGQDNPEAMPA
jgi:hypothetical protein